MNLTKILIFLAVCGAVYSFGQYQYRKTHKIESAIDDFSDKIGRKKTVGEKIDSAVDDVKNAKEGIEEKIEDMGK